MAATITRNRLLTMIGQTPGLWLVEACAGSGKTTLARQLARELGCDVSPKVPVDYGTAAEPIVVDIADGVWDPAPDEVAFLKSRPDTAMTVVSARLTTRAGQELGAELGGRWLRASDLWFDDAELGAIAEASLAVDDARRFAKGLRSITDAWPPAVEECMAEAKRVGGGDCGDFGTAAAAAFGAVFGPVADRLDDADRHGLEAVAYFDRFDDSMADAIGQPELLRSLVEAGVPLRDDGRWASLGDVAKSVVRERAGKQPHVDVALFDHLVRNGQVIEAAEAATELGEYETAADVLSGLNADQSLALDVDRTAAIVASLGATIDGRPRSFLVRARQHLGAGDLTGTIELLRRGVEVAGATDDRSAAEELTAELAFALYLSGDLAAAEDLLPDELFATPSACARQYEVIAGLDALTMERDALVRAGENYRLAERLWIENGSVAQAGSTLMGLAMEVTSRQGRLGEAIALLERASRTASAKPIRRAQTVLTRVRLLALAGRHDEAERLLDEADGLVGIVLRGFMAAHASQARAIIASHRGDAEEVKRLIEAASADLGDLALHAPGASLHADAVDVYARCGLADLVDEHLAALRAHPGAEPPDVKWAEIVAACRVGDAERGLALIDDFRAGHVAVPGGEWKLDFVASVALERLGRITDAETALAAAGVLCRAVGTPDIIDLTESQSAHSVSSSSAFSLLAADGSTTAARVRIFVLGDFAVEVDGHTVALPKGQGRTLLKLLALRGGDAAFDELLEGLWPGGDPEVGRRRVRNIFSRLRAACGEILLRDGEMVSFADDVATDFGDWWARSIAALGAGGQPDLDTFDALLTEAPDLLLPTDRYEEWLQPLQRRYQVQLLRIVDQAASLAAEVGEIDRAVGYYRRGYDVDPWTDERLDAAIALLRSEQRDAEISALQLLRESA